MPFERHYHFQGPDDGAKIWRQYSNDFQKRFEKKRHEWLDLGVFKNLYQTKDLDNLGRFLKGWSQYKHLFVLGMGGSSLGGRCLLEAFSVSDKVDFIDTLDPTFFHRRIKDKPIHQCGVMVISKSGETAETIMQMQDIIDHWHIELSENELKDHIVVITQDNSSSIGKLAQFHNIPVFKHPHDVGGRFSIFTLGGVAPALFVGLDILSIRHAAAQHMDEFLTSNNKNFAAPVLGAAFMATMMDRGATQHVTMTYGENLRSLGGWYAQLLGESLGKNGKGITPIVVSGPRDQHSQLQLYLDGPKDKMFTFIGFNHFDDHETLLMPKELRSHESIIPFHGKNLGDLMKVEQNATMQTFVNHHIPFRSIILKGSMTNTHFSGLIIQFMLEILLLADYLKINPFDQPAVEEGKKIALAMLNDHKDS